MMSNKHEIDDEPDDYDRLLMSIGRTFEQDQRVVYHELGHYLLDRLAATNGISFISVTPSQDHEGICLGTRNEAFVKVGAKDRDRLDAADVRQILAPTMPKPGEPRGDKADVYASVLDAVTQLMAGEAAEQLMLGAAQHASDDRRQAAELAKLICKTNMAVARLIDFGFQQALDVLSEHVALLRSLGVVLRARRDVTADDMDNAAAHAIELVRRRDWQNVLARAGSFKAEECRG
jgi:hypothetical protein